MRFVVIYPLLLLFIVFRGIWPAFDSKKVRLWLIASLIPGALFPAVVRFIGGSMVAPDLPYWVVIVGQFCQMYVFCLGAILVAREVVSVPARILGLPFPWLGRCTKLTVAIFAAAMLLDAYGVWTAAYDMTVKRVTVAVKNLPSELEGLTIAQLSDIHVSSLVHRDRVQKIVDATNALNPDVVLITGDFVDGEVDKRGPDLQPLTQLKAPLGVWGVLGNHEYYVDYEGWRTFLPTLNIGMLYNAHTVLTKNGASFTVAGLLDPMAERYGLELPDLDKALAGAPKTDLTILLSHQPKWAQKYVNQAQLMLSGHTHGAQVWLLRPVVSELNSGFVEGLYPVTDDKTGAKLQLYVNPGIDVWNGFVLRIGTRGEITLLTLTREK